MGGLFCYLRFRLEFPGAIPPSLCWNTTVGWESGPSPAPAIPGSTSPAVGCCEGWSTRKTAPTRYFSKSIFSSRRLDDCAPRITARLTHRSDFCKSCWTRQRRLVRMDSDGSSVAKRAPDSQEQCTAPPLPVSSVCVKEAWGVPFDLYVCTITPFVSEMCQSAHHQLNYSDVKRRRPARWNVSGGGTVESEGEHLLSRERV